MWTVPPDGTVYASLSQRRVDVTKRLISNSGGGAIALIVVTLAVLAPGAVCAPTATLVKTAVAKQSTAAPRKSFLAVIGRCLSCGWTMNYPSDSAYLPTRTDRG